MIKPYLLFTFLLITIFSCSSGKKEPVIYPLPENAEELLSGVKSKTWKLAKRTNGKTRVNMNDCTMSFRQTYGRDYRLIDNNGQLLDCGPSIKGTWHLTKGSDGQGYLGITGEVIPTLFKVEEGSSTKFFKITLLTDTMLIYRFKHQLFGNETTMIEDILIPESASDEGRYYHF